MSKRGFIRALALVAVAAMATPAFALPFSWRRRTISRERIGPGRELRAQLSPELRVADLDASIRFYCSAGFTLTRRTRTFAALRLDGAYLLLSGHPEIKVGAQTGNIRIIVKDVDAMFAMAHHLGWKITHTLADRGYGLRDFTVGDPDGYEMRFAEVNPEASRKATAAAAAAAG